MLYDYLVALDLETVGTTSEDAPVSHEITRLTWATINCATQEISGERSIPILPTWAKLERDATSNVNPVPLSEAIKQVCHTL